MITHNTGTGPGESPVLFSARPEPMSFLFRYILSFTPVMLFLLGNGIRGILNGFFPAAASGFQALVPVPATPSSAGSRAAMAQYSAILDTGMPGMGELIALAILLIAPVCIFLLAAAIGSELRRPEVWAGTLLTLIPGLIFAYLLAGSSSFSIEYLVLFPQWIAFLVQPFSIAASLLVLWGTERFRRSIRYTITEDAVVIRGGIFRHVEQVIPHARIGGVIREEDLLGSRSGYGTVIPRSITGDERGAPGQTSGAGTRAGLSPEPARLLLRHTGPGNGAADHRRPDGQGRNPG